MPADPAELLTDNQIDLRLRVAFTLLLLYGQPLSRIVRLAVFPAAALANHCAPRPSARRPPRTASPPSPGRVSALRQFVLQAPAPVVADALGVHYTTAHRHREQAGGTWSRYAPGDHRR
ncbi:hypothetical protein [Nocardia sp. CY41]|uniref:hypothetical protein n=1 Tax=Nocardia sp. CY41 TaxID=2608686 RepID=UPI0019166377|nr:hypothetical protein [Nocardia sp. CY41]